MSTACLPLNLPFSALQPGQCMFACNDAAHRAGHLFCGHPVAEGKPYCLHHCAIAYSPTKARQ
jgi:hypothetical protein